MQSNPDQTGALSALHDLIERNVLSETFENAPSQIFVLDAESLRFVAANAAARQAVARSLANLRKLSPTDLIAGLGPDRMRRIFDMVRQRKTGVAAFSLRAPSGDDRHLTVSIRFADAVKPSFLVFLSEVSTPPRLAALANRTLRSAIEVLPDGFVLYDSDDRMVICNQQYLDIYKLSAPAMRPGARFEDILRYGLDRGQYVDARGNEEAWLKARLAAHRDADQMIEQQISDGRWMRIYERQTPDGGRVGLRVDITEIKEQQAMLDNLSRTDDLTGTLNRRGLIDRVYTLARQIPDGQRLVTLQVDLDRFKIINDLYGHEAGDFVLVHCAAIMTSDAVQPAAAARVGGDEFVIVLCTALDDAALLNLAQGLVADLSRPFNFDEARVNVGASIGLAVLRPEQSNPVKDMLMGADVAMNRAKQAGGNAVLVFHEAMRKESARNNRMVEQIKLGLTRQEFEPYFQPQIDVKRNKIIGFEALIRWKHPIEGLIPAFQFLEVAHRSGLTEALDDVVMDRSCHAVRQLLDWGMKRPRVSINMSIAQISDPTIVSRLNHFMDIYNISASNLRIELLESTLLDKQSSQIVRNVHELIAAGFPVELDDFGTGHAAIATLREFAVSCIKIDRSLVQNIDSDTELQVITSAIINLAVQLGIAVLAEGVETVDEESTLREMGCYRVQGYLHAKPMPLSHLRQFVDHPPLPTFH